VISNHWHKPGISVTILHGWEAPKGGIKLEMPLEDFLMAVAAEANHPAGIFTRAQFVSALKAAAASAIDKVKESSIAAVASHE
ncbi:MAG: hypothetical protein ABIO88_10555, partial [Burkholderiaceae bacterium]